MRICLICGSLPIHSIFSENHRPVAGSVESYPQMSQI